MLDWGRTVELQEPIQTYNRECSHSSSSQFFVEKRSGTFQYPIFSISHEVEIFIILGQTRALKNWQFCQSAFRFSCRCRSRVERCRGHVDPNLRTIFKISSSSVTNIFGAQMGHTSTNSPHRPRIDDRRPNARRNRKNQALGGFCARMCKVI